ncbi:hypothetical protein FRC04_001053 [Tulasnella sp. 424]|nr:hypothetical protein FRC04_001053 [Tulasnella sp. 424]
MEVLREEFDEETKCIFHEEDDEALYVRIGGRRDNYEDENDLCKIEFGNLEVQRNEVVQAFEPSIKAIVESIKKHADGQKNTHVFLVGGFAASPWVLSETNRRLKNTGVIVKRADTNTAKAVAHGGVGFYLDRYVAERTTRFTYGLALRINYDPSNLEHVKRFHNLQTDPVSGEVVIPGGFCPLVKKGEQVKVDSVYRMRVRSGAYRAPEFYSWEQSLVRYSGSQDDITFVDMDRWFECEMPAAAMTRRKGKHGRYWSAGWEVVITLGTVEIKCQVKWDEKGVQKKTPAHSIWEDYY